MGLPGACWAPPDGADGGIHSCENSLVVSVGNEGRSSTSSSNWNELVGPCWSSPGLPGCCCGCCCCCCSPGDDGRQLLTRCSMTIGSKGMRWPWIRTGRSANVIEVLSGCWARAPEKHCFIRSSSLIIFFSSDSCRRFNFMYCHKNMMTWGREAVCTGLEVADVDAAVRVPSNSRSSSEN